MKTAVEIYKLLPKTNCGACGMPTCFGFATKVAAGMASIDACTNLSEAVRRELARDTAGRRESPGTVYEQALMALRPKFAALDLAALAKTFGADVIAPGRIAISFLNARYTITRDRITDDRGTEPLPFISILIYNHLCMPAPPQPSGEWITFSSVPASHAKDKAWAGHVEDVIARHFAGNAEGLRAACEALGGIRAEIKGSHDAAYEFRFFPRYPALLLFYDAVPEENFPAQVKLLLDRNVDRYLDIESIVVLGEEFAGRMTG
ncbi:MAG: DUF3786 domain-containing protein [Nitrospiraceae bacterium]|nr:DUF3786 domain-containing protein [Nitrospiraceae bacterium]